MEGWCFLLAMPPPRRPRTYTYFRERTEVRITKGAFGHTIQGKQDASEHLNCAKAFPPLLTPGCLAGVPTVGSKEPLALFAGSPFFPSRMETDGDE